MKNTTINDVENFWNSESCGERYALGQSNIEKFRSEEKKRYDLEPYIKEFANFKQFKDLNVLEIGVGYGADHSQIAKEGPKSLTGIDLTQRAIENTNLRFETLKLKSTLKTDNAESLSFQSNTFDAVYSWGVIHHSPDTPKCFSEIYRVLKKDGIAKIMIYHKYSPTGLMLYIKYGLLKGNPFLSFNEIYSDYLESPGTKAYSRYEVQEMVKEFSDYRIEIKLNFGDLLKGDVGVRHKGFILSLAKFIYPAMFVKIISKIFPIGLCLLITLKK